MSEGGVRFGEYVLLARLGSGGMAETFLAARTDPHGVSRRVCLKRILPAFSSDPEFRRLFLEEACVSARLRHKGLAQVVDFGRSGETYYLALELIEGGDLKALVRALREAGESLPAHLVTYIALELAGTLDYAHCNDADGRPRGVVHRDISPANILVSLSGEVKLTDLGVAKAVSGATLTRTRSVKGKLPYMAPEYAKEGRYDARSDLFSLGVTLYELSTGYRPFDGANELATLQRLESGDHAPVLERAPATPPALAAAIERLLHPEPAARFTSGAELVDALLPIAPSPLAAIELGALVGRYARTPDALDGADPTLLEVGSPSRTVVLPPPEEVAPSPSAGRAGPGDPTRTRHAPVTAAPPKALRPEHGGALLRTSRLGPLRIAAIALAAFGLLSLGALYGAWLAVR